VGARLLVFLLLAGSRAVNGYAGVVVFYVATGGDDANGDGSAGNPWATITRAVDTVPDGSTVLVLPGTYFGRVHLRREFNQGIVVRSQVAYQARLRNDGTVVTCFYGKGITLEGFDIAHSGAGASALVVQIQDLIGAPGGNDFVSRITLRNNILHDSFDNDILKVNNGAGNILIEGNLFYNQSGSDEHIDVNSVTDVVIQDNVFFNDFAGSGRTNANDTSSYVVIKDSNGASDSNLGSHRVTVRRNVFLNWEGSTGHNFVLVGEDGNPYFEAQDVLVENNLMLGHSRNVMRAPFGVKGGRSVTFRHNTVAGDFPSLAFAMRLNTEGSNPANENIQFFNNVWSDPTGTMEDFSDAPPGQTASFTLRNNLYWNGGAALPQDAAEQVNYTDDARRLVADLQLPGQAGVVPPRWDGAAGRFAEGSTTIREAFVRLVSLYGRPAPGSAVLGAAEPGTAAAQDILGNPRPASAPDLGAFQSGGTNYALRFFGNGVNAPDRDRVKIRIDDPATSLPGPPADVGAQDFTIELWMKGLAAENADGTVPCGPGNGWIYGNIVLDRDRFNQPRKFGLSLSGGVLAFGVDGPAESFTLCGTADVLDGAWHHVALQRRRSDGRMWIWVDGLPDGEVGGPDGDISYPDDGVPGNFCGGPCVNSDPFLVIGAEKHDAGAQFPSYSGWIDEMRISNSIRYSTGFARPPAPFVPDAATAALYHFDEGSGDVVNDASGALGGPSPGERRFGGNPAGPQWVLSDAPFGGGSGQTVTVAFAAASSSAPEAGGAIQVGVVVQTPDGNPTAAPVSLRYQTSDETAIAGSDYSAASGTLSLAAGRPSGSVSNISITILNDVLDEADETFLLVLSNPSGASLGAPSSHRVTIADDDAPPTLAIGDVSVTEGNAGTVNAVFAVSLSAPSGRTASVNYQTANGTAEGGTDYQAISGSVNLAPGQTLQTVGVAVIGDTTVEPDETFFVRLSGATNAGIADGEGLGTILNDDAPGPPGTPVLVSPAGLISVTTPTYIWNAVAGAGEYYLWINGPSGRLFNKWYLGTAVCSGAVCSVGAAQEPLLPALSEGAYVFWVQARNAAGTGPWSAAMTFRVSAFTSPPGIPQLLSPAGSIPEARPTFRWQELPSATEYYLWVNQASANVIKQWFPASGICSAGSCSVLSPLTFTPGAHLWWVQARNGVGDGPWSAGLGFVAGDLRPPGMPTLVSPTGVTADNQPAYAWVELAAATEYYLWVNGPSGNLWNRWYPSSSVCANGSCSVGRSTNPAPPALAEGPHVFWVQARNAAGAGPWSSATPFRVSAYPNPPPAATLVSPSGATANGTPTYVWNAVGTATRYFLWVNGPAGNILRQTYDASAVCQGSTCTVRPTLVLAAGAHVWWIQSQNGAGDGPWSAAMPFTVQP
jgi:hypothetical protein